MERSKRLPVSCKLPDRKRPAVDRFHHRRVFAYACIVARPCKKRRYRINPLPEPQRIRIIRQRLCDQQCAPVQLLFPLLKMDPAIPHHRLEIPFQRFIARIIAARLILAVILLFACDRRYLDALCPPDFGKLLRHCCIRRPISQNAVVQKLCPDRKKYRIALCRFLPFASGEFLVLRPAVLQHPDAQLL